MTLLSPSPAPAPAPAPVVDTEATLTEWYAITRQIAELKTREMTLRKTIEASTFFDQSKLKGTQTKELGAGYQLKLVRRITTKVENKKNEAFDALIKLRNLGGISIEHANDLFTFDANMKTTVYNLLSDEEKSIIDPIVTTKQGSPDLKIIEPKAKK